MKLNLIFISTAVSLLVFSACQQTVSSSDMTKVKAEIQNLENAWADALNARNLDALMSMYTDDAISMSNSAPMAVGKDAIRSSQQMEFDKTPESLIYSFETLDVYGTGDLVTETGKSTYKNAEGQVVGSGKYMVVWENQNGKYLCKREIYNTDSHEQASEVRSIHLFDLPTGLSEAEWLNVINEINSALAENGYPDAKYNMYKTNDDQVKNYRYFFEGVWPSEEVYQKVRENAAIKAAYDKSQAQYDKIKANEIYRKMSRVE
jgi:uncharacterized protein (TIGR02246 family)